MCLRHLFHHGFQVGFGAADMLRSMSVVLVRVLKSETRSRKALALLKLNSLMVLWYAALALCYGDLFHLDGH